MSTSSYFVQLEREQSALQRRGFDRWPSQGEAAEYAFAANDKVEALAAALGLRLCRDYRNRWIVVEARDAS